VYSRGDSANIPQPWPKDISYCNFFVVCTTFTLICIFSLDRQLWRGFHQEEVRLQDHKWLVLSS